MWRFFGQPENYNVGPNADYFRLKLKRAQAKLSIESKSYFLGFNPAQTEQAQNRNQSGPKFLKVDLSLGAKSLVSAKFPRLDSKNLDVWGSNLQVFNVPDVMMYFHYQMPYLKFNLKVLAKAEITLKQNKMKSTIGRLYSTLEKASSYF